MKTYTITVNGKAYAVTVEEGATAGAPVAAAPVAAPAAAPAPAAVRHRVCLSTGIPYLEKHQQAQQVPFRLPLQCQVR